MLAPDPGLGLDSAAEIGNEVAAPLDPGPQLAPGPRKRPTESANGRRATTAGSAMVPHRAQLEVPPPFPAGRWYPNGPRRQGFASPRKSSAPLTAAGRSGSRIP